MSEYKVKFYKNSLNQKEPVLDYLEKLDQKNKAKILKYIEFLREHNGYLDEPYSKHIFGKIRELRVDFSKKRHRIFYFTFINQTIVLLHSFSKKTPKTPKNEIEQAKNNLNDVINNPKLYE
ncbi:type II toxin-antitoxin system RelE/ParE family toxin [Candidatus Parcubacteria bacterium]|nr:type II toxin-antitoxin system RelE/ParE family toxin [Candidatus Parcubacteria bacterium]